MNQLCDPNSQWAFIAVLVKKSAVSLSRNGKKYSTWTLTDLMEVTANVCLFGEAHFAHWKDPLGSVVVVLCPQAIASVDKTSKLLTCNAPNQIVRLGRSTDLAYCKAVRRRQKRLCGRAIHARHNMFVWS